MSSLSRRRNCSSLILCLLGLLVLLSFLPSTGSAVLQKRKRTPPPAKSSPAQRPASGQKPPAKAAPSTAPRSTPKPTTPKTSLGGSTPRPVPPTPKPTAQTLPKKTARSAPTRGAPRAANSRRPRPTKRPHVSQKAAATGNKKAAPRSAPQRPNRRTTPRPATSPTGKGRRTLTERRKPKSSAAEKGTTPTISKPTRFSASTPYVAEGRKKPLTGVESLWMKIQRMARRTETWAERRRWRAEEFAWAEKDALETQVRNRERSKKTKRGDA